jgi:hypothetical protein
MVAAPPAGAADQQAAVASKTLLPWWLLVVVLAIVLAGVGIALVMMEHGGGMYIVLTAGLVLLVVTVTYLVIREMHKPVEEEEPEEAPISSSGLFVQALRQAAAEAERRNAVLSPLALAGARTESSATAVDAESKVPLPFEAYQGREPFLFASYSHKDAALVYPEIGRLHRLGYRVWYDEGICPGQEWPEAVADALKHASFFVVFISPRALDSSNVRNEINLALKKRKPFLAIHLEQTELPGGVELQIGSLQAILKYLVDGDRYSRRLEVSLPAELREA